MATQPVTYLEADRNQPPDPHPTEPKDYATLNAVYAVLLGGVLYTPRERAREDPIRPDEFGPIAAATFALSKVVVREKIGAWVREPFVEEEDGDKHPRGRGLRAVVGELVTCTRCVGAWSAMTVVGLRLAQPQAGRAFTNVLAASAASDWLQAGFRWRWNKADAARG